MSGSSLLRWGGLAAAAAVALLAWWAWASRAQGTAPPPRAPADSPVPVIVAPVAAATDALQVEAVGTGLALRSATLQPAVAGEVASLHFQPGQRVRRGQVLLRLVDRKERLALDMAGAEVDAARRLVDRLARTEGTGAVPGSVIDDARSTLQRAEIAQAQAREALGDLALRAPFDGVVGLAGVDPGDRVTPETPITTLDDRRRLLVAFDLPEPYLARIGPGHAVEVTNVAYAGRRFDGRVTQIDNRLAADTRTLRLRAELPNDDDLLRPGMSFQVRLALAGGTQLQVPDLALQWGRDGGHVWVLRDGKAEQVPVRLMRRLEGTVLIEGALQPGEPVVVEGVQRLRPGRAVTVVEPAP